MMKYVFTLAIATFAVAVHAQTQTNKINLSAGGGFENYDGDLGSTFFKTHEEVYGFVTLRVGYYLNSSFDVLAYGTKGDFGHCREWGASPEILNMRSRMTSFNIALKYKFSNGYLLKENARISPFLLA